ncbi:CoA ester lyase [Burkholderia sp. Ax-1719]|uniref:HpcH/HpaI aldolase/citrate lyase family protein n=1 Tax=Burkholderia sp. Ax-1719 TaxID=2608334 RepID=UPI00141E23E5|nr:CoA ester lyase [Burkholderia sp. Ax-1719]NIE63188.1 CoA ester lyase [Burkholderia sp. Ax-1719]
MKSQNTFIPQSYLFVPGSRPERFQSALNSGADAVIIDLEDAVESSAKDAARATLAQWLSPERPVLVRINGRGTEWFEKDAQLASHRGVAGIVLPKAEALQDVSDVVARARRRVPVYPLIETAKGMWSALEIAKAPFVQRLMFGTLDFIAEMEMSDPTDSLDTFRTRLSLISRVAGIESPVDGVTADIHNSVCLEEEARNGKRLGFGAKLCIHPRQIATVHACYGPSEPEVKWATRVIEAFDNSNGGVTTVDGKMIDRPVLLRARKLLAIAAWRQIGNAQPEVTPQTTLATSVG